MKASQMHTGQTLVVKAGPLKGTEVEVIDPRPIPDGQENQRAVTVRILGEQDNLFIIPKLLCTQAEWSAPAPQQVAALTPVLRVVEGEPTQVLPDKVEVITDPMHPSLDRFRPNAAVVKQYIRRELANDMTDVEFFMAHRQVCIDQDRAIEPLALVGPTQAGKTMLVEVLACVAAEAEGYPKPLPIFTLNGSVGITSYDLFGQPTAVTIGGKETIVWMEGLVPMAVRLDAAILYLDEWNAVPASQAVALHPLLDHRRSFTNYKKAIPDGMGGWSPETVDASNKLWVITTINPGYKGTQSMAEASTNRFRWFNWDYDPKVEERLIPSTTVLAMGAALREALAQRVLNTPTGTSALQRFLSDVVHFGADMAIYSMVSMFPPMEQDRVRVIIEDRGFKDLLNAEYPEPKYGKQPGAQPEPEVEPY